MGPNSTSTTRTKTYAHKKGDSRYTIYWVRSSVRLRRINQWAWRKGLSLHISFAFYFNVNDGTRFIGLPSSENRTFEYGCSTYAWWTHTGTVMKMKLSCNVKLGIWIESVTKEKKLLKDERLLRNSSFLMILEYLLFQITVYKIVECVGVF